MARRVADAGTAFMRWGLVYAALVTAASRRLLAQHSILFFAWYYFGITLALHQEVWAHRFIRNRRHLLLSPRGHGKTEFASKMLPLWLIVRNRNVRILMVSLDTRRTARKLSMSIRAELESNKQLIRDFGVFYDRRRCPIWEQTIFQVVRDKKMKDPTVEAIGIDASITGGRFDYIIFDDVIDLHSTNTPELIAKTLADVKGTILPLLEPDGCAWMIGTRKNFSDLYGWALTNPLWSHTVERAIIREPAHEIVVLDEPIIRADGTEQLVTVRFTTDDQGECLWPEHKSMEDLLLERHELGTVVFNREYQNQVVDDATAMFRLAWLQQCRDESLSYIRGHITDEVVARYEVIGQGVDPSLVTDKRQAERADSDYMVQVAIGLDKRRDRYLLALDRERGLSPREVEDRIKAFYDRVRPFRCAIERNAFGTIHVHNLIEGTDMKITRHDTTGQNKNDPYEGVPHLSALFENGKIHLPYATAEDQAITDKLIAELHAFGSDIHDDQVMAFWICEYLLLRYLKGQARMRRINQRTSA